jgi:hypothetical protein
MATENQTGEVETEIPAAGALLQSRRLFRQEVLEEIRTDIIKHRGSLDGLLDEFLAERREEAARE